MASDAPEQLSSALLVAAATNDLAAVERLLEQGADINAQDEAGWTPLHIAAAFARAELATLLLRHGAELAVASTGRKLARGRLWPMGTTPYDLVTGSTMKALFDEAASGPRPQKTAQSRSELAPATTAENPALQQLLHADPENREHYQVYSDWLQTQGDPRGEWIALSLRAEEEVTAEEASARTKAEAQLLATYGEHLLGPAADRQFFEAIWSRGFIRALRVRSPYDAKMVPLFREQFDALWAHPSTRLIRELQVLAHSVFPLDELLQLFERTAQPRLTTVVLDAGQEALTWSHHHWRVWRSVPRLVLRRAEPGYRNIEPPRRGDVGSLDLATRELYLVGGLLDNGQIAEMAKVRWPQLEVLQLETCSGDAFLLELLRPDRFPRLRVLSLLGWDRDTDGSFFRGLFASGLLAQLEELHFGVVRDFSSLARLMLSSARQLQHLKRMTMAPYGFQASIWDKLRSRFPGDLELQAAPVFDELSSSLSWPFD